MDDLDEFLEDVETQSIIGDSDQFNDMVDIIANEQRERGEQIVEYQENGMNDQEVSDAASEALDENGNPLWMKFLKADYLGENDQKNASIKIAKSGP